MKWIGLENYVQMFRRESFVQALVITGAYILALIPFYLVIPLALAALLGAVRQSKPRRSTACSSSCPPSCVCHHLSGVDVDVQPVLRASQ